MGIPPYLDCTDMFFIYLDQHIQCYGVEGVHPFFPLLKGLALTPLRLKTITPSRLETLFFTNLLEFSIGRDSGAPKGFKSSP